MRVISIQQLDTNVLISFSCGVKELDVYFKKYALNNENNGYGKTFVLEDNEVILGFFTLCTASIKFDEYPVNSSSKMPKYPIPCVRIARLAVNKNYQGRGYGRELLKQAFIRILSVEKTIGLRLVIVDAKSSSASFYEKYGFQKLSEDSFCYYMNLETLKMAIS